MQRAPRILYIIVNYRHAQLSAELARKILSLPRSESVQVMIVDNSETSADRDFFTRIPNEKNLSVVTPAHNLGFYNGADFGLTSYLEGRPLPEWIIVSNPDMAFPDMDFLSRLLQMRPAPDLGALAPDIHLAPTPDEWGRGRAQNPLMEERPSAVRLRLLETIFRVGALYELLVLRHRLRSRTPAQPAGLQRPIYAPHGCCIIFSRNYFERGGHLRHGAFLYGEEIFVAEELRLRGLKCLFEPALRLSHIGGASTRVLGNRRLRKFNAEAMRFLRLRYFSSSASEARKH